MLRPPAADGCARDAAARRALAQPAGHADRASAVAEPAGHAETDARAGAGSRQTGTPVATASACSSRATRSSSAVVSAACGRAPPDSAASPSHQRMPISSARSTEATTRRMRTVSSSTPTRLTGDVARDHDPLVEDPLEDVGQAGAADAVLQGQGDLRLQVRRVRRSAGRLEDPGPVEVRPDGSAGQ